MDATHRSQKEHTGQNVVSEISEQQNVVLTITKKLVLECEFCPYTTSKAMEFMLHQKTHNTSFNCKQCSFTSSSRFAFEMHLQSDHTIKEVPQPQQCFSCTICDMIFADGEDLKGHSIRQHTDDDKEGELFQCDQCKFTTKEEVVFRQHILTSHVPGFECHECETIIKTKDLVVGCSVCEFFFHKKCTSLAKSQGGHWKPKSWTCHYCCMKQSTVVDNAEANIKDAFNKEHSTSNPNKVTLNSRHRKSNLNMDKPDLEFLQSQLDSCRGIIAQREAELKKVKESDSLKAKRIMQLDAQLQEARNLINKSFQSTETGAQIPKADEPTNDYNNKQRHSNEDVKIILLEAKTNTLEHQMTSMSSKLDSLQAMLFVKDNIKEKSGSCQCPGPENKTETPKDDEDDSSPSTEDKSNAESELDIESQTL